MSSIALTGNGYLELTRNQQKDVTGLWFLNPACVQPIRQADGSIAYRTTEGLAPGNFKLLQAADVIHVPWHSLNGVTGISPIAQARNAIAYSIAMDKFNGRFFANNATPSGILTLPAGLKAKPEDKPRCVKIGRTSSLVAISTESIFSIKVRLSHQSQFHKLTLSFLRVRTTRGRRFLVCSAFTLHRLVTRRVWQEKRILHSS